MSVKYKCMNFEQRISAFISLGDMAKNLSANNEANADFCKIITRATAKNAWFTQENCNQAINTIADFLQEQTLSPLHKVSFPDKCSRIAILFSGESPLDGFIDALCVLLSGNSLVARLAPNDVYLPTFFFEKLIAIEPAFKAQIEISDGILPQFDAIIANKLNPSLTQYIKKYPHLIHKQTCSVAILNGKETENELQKLGHDIFHNFGRNNKTVAKLFLPETFDETNILQATEQFNAVTMHNKYMNNYEYNKSIYLVTRQKHLDNGFLLLKEDVGFKSPIAVVFYEKYSDIAHVGSKLEANKEIVLHIVSNLPNFHKQSIPFGDTYKIQENEYMETLSFLQTV